VGAVPTSRKKGSNEEKVHNSPEKAGRKTSEKRIITLGKRNFLVPGVWHGKGKSPTKEEGARPKSVQRRIQTKGKASFGKRRHSKVIPSQNSPRETRDGVAETECCHSPKKMREKKKRHITPIHLGKGKDTGKKKAFGEGGGKCSADGKKKRRRKENAVKKAETGLCKGEKEKTSGGRGPHREEKKKM